MKDQITFLIILNSKWRSTGEEDSLHFMFGTNEKFWEIAIMAACLPVLATHQRKCSTAKLTMFPNSIPHHRRCQFYMCVNEVQFNMNCHLEHMS
jgi:hypothetical protein